MSYRNRASKTYLEEQVAAALAAQFPKATLPIGGRLVPSKDVQAKIRKHVATIKLLMGALAKYRQLVATERSESAELAPILAGVRSYAAAMLGEKSPEFAAFGFAPRRVAQRSVESKAQAAQKVRATRAARKSARTSPNAGATTTTTGKVAAVASSNGAAA